MVQFNLCDEYEPYLEEIKGECMRNVGALPQVAATRDEIDLTKKHKLFTKHSEKEYKIIGDSFKSPLFNFTMANFMVKRTEFCMAGKWSYVLNLATGILKPCYGSYNYQNIYKNPQKPIGLSPIGRHCPSPFCMNSSHFMSLGVIPELKVPTYGELRNRRGVDGVEWYNETFKQIAYHKLHEGVKPQMSIFERSKIEYAAFLNWITVMAMNMMPSSLISKLKLKFKR